MPVCMSCSLAHCLYSVVRRLRQGDACLHAVQASAFHEVNAGSEQLELHETFAQSSSVR